MLLTHFIHAKIKYAFDPLRTEDCFLNVEISISFILLPGKLIPPGKVDGNDTDLWVSLCQQSATLSEVSEPIILPSKK